MYDKEKADDAVDFIQSLRQHQGKYAGKKLILAYWQEKIIRDIFGTVNEDGTRQYRTAYIEIPRKNGKTEKGAGIALLLLFADDEQGAEIYSAAGDHEQAAKVYEAAAPMVRQSKTLRKIGKIIDSVKRIIVPESNSFYKVISAESKTKHGGNLHGVIFDELHVQPNRNLWDVLTTSGGTREQPLVVAITTAGFDRNSICWEQHDYAQKVLSGVIVDPTFYAVIFAANEDDDWTDENVWHKVNPALNNFSAVDEKSDLAKYLWRMTPEWKDGNVTYKFGDTGTVIPNEFIKRTPGFRSINELRALCNKAKEVVGLQNTFKRLYLNIWTSQETRWMEIEKWDESEGKVELEELKDRICYGGLDLSTTTDLSAFVIVFPVGENYKVVSEFFIPADNIEARVRKDRVPYDVWVRDGFIKATPGNVIDYQFVEDTILNYAKDYDMRILAVDPYNATHITQRIKDRGIETVDVHQGWKSMSPPTKQLQALILQRKIHHGGNPVLRWCFDNVMVMQDANGNLKPDKENSREKIDGIIALILAISQAKKDEGTGIGAMLI